jgi:hypothetical protein
MTQEDDEIVRAQHNVCEEVRKKFCLENQKKKDDVGHKSRIKEEALTKGLHKMD